MIQQKTEITSLSSALPGKEKSYWYLYLLLFVTINWRVVPFDAAMRIPFVLLTVFALWHIGYFMKKKYLLLWFWVVWAMYMFVNTWVAGLNPYTFRHGLYDLAVNLLMPCELLFLVVRLFELNPKKTVNVALITVAVKCIIFILLGGYRISSLGSDRWMNTEAVNINEVGLTMVICEWLVILWANRKDHPLPGILKLGLLLLLMICVILTASRTSFFAFAFVLIASFVAKMNLKSASTYLFLFLLVPCVFFFSSFVINETVLGERILGTSDDVVLLVGENFLTKIMGDRSVYYIEGARIFREYPWCGVGFYNYMLYNTISSHICHADYIIQVAEGGIIGSFLYILFYFGLIRNAYRRFLKAGERSRDFVYLLGVLMILVMNFATFTCYRPIYFIVLGIAIGYTLTDPEHFGKEESAPAGAPVPQKSLS